jgi:hypothetical protein
MKQNYLINVNKCKGRLHGKLTRCSHIFGLFIAFLLMPMVMMAQVTIGKLQAPTVFSILELNTETLKVGLRLPQLTKAEREAMRSTFAANTPADARGLVIFNLDTSTECLEFWNGTVWIALKGVPSPQPTGSASNKQSVILPEKEETAVE